MDSIASPAAAPAPGLMGGGQPAAQPNSAPASAEPAPAASSAPASILGEDGKFSPKWYQGNADLEPFATQLDKFTDPAGLAKSYAHLEKTRTVPAEGADAGAIENFRKANGIPATHEEYDFAFPENLPDGISIDDNAVAKYKEVFHSLNLTPYQAQKLAAHHLELTQESLKGMAGQQGEAAQAEVANLRKEWGNGYQGKLETAQNAFEKVCQQAGIESGDLPFTGSAAFAKIMHTVAGMLGESGVVGAGGGGNPLRSGKQEANEIMTNQAHPDYKAYYNPNDPRHAEVFERVARLNH